MLVALGLGAGCQAEVHGGFQRAAAEEDAKADGTGDGDHPDDADTDPAPPDDDGPAPPDDLDAPGGATEREPNDDPGVATQAGVPAAVILGELAVGDRDYYLLTVVERGGYVLETSTGDVGDDQATDTQIEVFRADAPAEAIAQDDDSGEGYGSRTEVNLSPGRFLVLVTGFGGSVTGPYALEISAPGDLFELAPEAAPGPLVPPAESDETEANDTVDSADSMGTDPATIGCELEAAGVDHFVFAASAPGTVTLETGARADEGPSVDTVVELYSADGVTMLGSDDDSADVPLYSRLTLELPAAGVYVAKVRGYSALSAGSYRLFFVR
jgi:hypothetical protein